MDAIITIDNSVIVSPLIIVSPIYSSLIDAIITIDSVTHLQ